MKLIIKQAVLTGALTVLSLLFASTTFGQIPGVIGIKLGFTGGYADSVVPAPTDQCGVIAVTNWQNLQADPNGPDQPGREQSMNLVWPIAQDSAGNALSGVTLTAAGWDDGWDMGWSDCPNARMLGSWWAIDTGNDSYAGFQDGAGNWYATCTIANLTAPFYDVYVYISDNNVNYWGNVAANSVLAVPGGLDSGNFNGSDIDPCSTNPELYTSAGGNPANYVKMPYVSTTVGGVIMITVTEQSGGMGVAGIELVPSSDLVQVQDTLPTYAETVVGDMVVFSAADNSSPATHMQWQQVVSGPATNNINIGVVNVTNSGVVTSTLTLSNVQLTNSGSYQLAVTNATNGSDFIFSTAAPLVVGNSPAPVNNVIVNYAGQTGNLSDAWTINTNTDLIYGFQSGWGPGTFIEGAGNFGMDFGNYNPVLLDTNIDVGDQSTDFVTCGLSYTGTGLSMTYTLDSQTYGYDVTNITVYGGWLNGNRNEQEYQVLYSTVSAPSTFISLVTPDYKANDPSSGPSATRVTLVPATGVLAQNVYAVEFNFNTAYNPENGWEGYSAITIGGTPSAAPALIMEQDITPLTAEDVVGSSVTLTASFTGATSYQWLSNGLPLPGAPNSPTLTLSPLQSTYAASYSLQGINSNGTNTTRACVLTVDPAPTPVGNVVTALAYQTDDTLPFSPTWSTADIDNQTPGVNLILNQDPPGGGNGAGSFTGYYLDHAGGLPVLTDGSYGSIVPVGNPAFATCAGEAGQYVIYTMPDTYGDDITNIEIVGGWGGDGRASQFYTAYYSTVASPTTFYPLTALEDNLNSPPYGGTNGGNAIYVRATFTPAAGLLAGNVAAIYINFATPANVPNGYSGYSEISVFGTASVGPPARPAPPVVSASVSSGNLILTGDGGTPYSPYTLLTTTNLAIPVADWTVLNVGSDGNGQTVSSGALNGSGAFSMSIPISTNLPASFYQLSMP